MFCPLNPCKNQAMKNLGRERSSDQGQFSLIKIPDPSHKHFYGDTY